MAKRSKKNYSLRTFFVAVTVIAILGWYRRLPKTVVVGVTAHPNYEKAIGMKSLWGAFNSPFPKRTETQTFRRNNFVNYVRDGETLVHDDFGRLIQRQLWNDGEQVSCSYWFRDGNGKVVSEGRTIKGRPHGTWKWYIANETNRVPRDYLVSGPDAPAWMLDAYPAEINVDEVFFGWNRWKRNYVARKYLSTTIDELQKFAIETRSTKLSADPTHVFEYDKGELVSVDSEPAKDFISLSTRETFPELFDAITVCNLSHQGLFPEMVSVLFGRSPTVIKASKQRRIASMMHGAPLPHSANLFLTLSRNQLALDYRFGHIFVLHAEDADEWKDTTGIEKLSKSPKHEARLKQYISVHRSLFVPAQRSLAEKFKLLSLLIRPQDNEGKLRFAFEPHELRYRDPSSLLKDPLMTLLSDGMTVKNAIGLILSEHGLTCELVGDTIMISEVKFK